MPRPPCIHVLGNASVDLTFSVPRLPARGETLMAHGLTRAPGGKGLNQAVVAARAGVAVRFCAPVGGDPDGEFVRAALASEPFAFLDLHRVAPHTDTSMLLVGDDAENAIVSTGDCADALPMPIATAFLGDVAARDVLLMQGNLTHDLTCAAARMARDRGARVLLNIAPIRWPAGDGVMLSDLVIANEGEAATATRCDDPRDAAAALGITAIVTLGARGCLLVCEQGLTEYAAPPVTAVDTTGAGDAFCGALAAGLVRGHDLPDAIARAQRAAALAVSRAGCFGALPTRAELADVFA